MSDTLTDTPIDTVLTEVAAALRARRLIPYLGPGAHGLLPDGACPIPRTAAELTARLNAKVAAPGRIRSSLTAVAQYIETRRHRKTLDGIMDALFRAEVPPSPVHRWLAALPPPPVIVDVWYDDVMEKLLAADPARVWGRIQGLSHPQSVGAWVRATAPDGSVVPETAAEGWDTVLYKPSGGVSPAGSYLVSDSDFVEILTEIDIQTPIPAVVKDRRAGRSFLFLGCRFDQEIQRTFARQIAKRSADRHWAVLPEEPTRNEARFLEAHGIVRIDRPAGEVVERLTAALAG